MENAIKNSKPSYKGKIMKRSVFQYVCYWRFDNHGQGDFKFSWRAFVPKSVTGAAYHSYHDTEHEAAKAVDKYLASHGFMPVNCLKKL